ncbi:kinase phosphorylation protein-domain-containing protein [Lipomyces doorenjongii]|uniref:kinase phosphorylation protein-domain-containing protein n=1 Tax=Lipomyces doorenjongii TaxID=383834 RepID=UPI0034CD64B4
MDLLSNRPTRDGIRGGQGSFSWDAVKQDKYRQNYLGHSVMAPTGRWAQKNDALWYSKEKNSTDVEKELDKEGLGEEELQLTKEELRRIELRRIKEAEEIAMAEALGIKPRLKSVDQKESSIRQSRSGSTSPEPRRRRSEKERESQHRYRDDRSPRPQRSHYHSTDDSRRASYDRRHDHYRSHDGNSRHHIIDGPDGRYRRGPDGNHGRHYYSRDRQRDDDERPHRRQRDRSQESTRQDSKDRDHDRRESREKDEVDKFLDGLGKPGDDGFIHHSRRKLIRE